MDRLRGLCTSATAALITLARDRPGDRAPGALRLQDIAEIGADLHVSVGGLVRAAVLHRHHHLDQT